MRSEQIGKLLCFVLGFVLLGISTGCGGGNSNGGSGSGGGGNSGAVSIVVDHLGVSTYPATTFHITVTAKTSGTTATPTISFLSLPAGLTTPNTFPMQVPATGAVVTFNVSASMAPGTYNFPITGAAGSATTQQTMGLTILSGSPGQTFFAGPIFREMGVTQGTSSSLRLSLMISTTIGSTYELALSASGLPAGTSATFNPQYVHPGDSFTVTVSASNDAPLTQNLPWTVTATPEANASATTASLLLDVTPPSGAGWTNKTDYTSTRSTPVSAVYDSVHQLIYASNNAWNRVDVISNVTHAIVQSITIRDPRGLDLAIDGSKVWVATSSQVMYSIDTNTRKTSRYVLPKLPPTTT
jgi:hypothetical protein